MSEKPKGKNIIERKKEEKIIAFQEGKTNYEAWMTKCQREPYDCASKLAEIECNTDFKGKKKPLSECNRAVRKHVKADEIKFNQEALSESVKESKIEKAKIKAQKEQDEIAKKLKRLKEGEALPEDIGEDEEEEETQV